MSEMTEQILSEKHSQDIRPEGKLRPFFLRKWRFLRLGHASLRWLSGGRFFGESALVQRRGDD